MTRNGERHASRTILHRNTPSQRSSTRTILAPADSKVKYMMATTVTRELPTPNVSRIYSLSQAHATLLHCRNRLARFMQECAAAAETASAADRARMLEERRQYQKWLERWEQAFTEYLSAAMASMATEDLTQSRVLKANHLACTVLASDAGPDAAAFVVFEAEFQAIVELAGAVLQSRQRPISPQSATSSEASPTTHELEVRDALLVVIARCSHRTIRQRANELLLRC